MSYFLELIPSIFLENQHLLIFIVLNPYTKCTTLNNILNRNKDLILKNIVDDFRYSYKLVKSKLIGDLSLPFQTILRKFIDTRELAKSMAMNLYTPKDILNELANSEDNLVRNLAETTIDELQTNKTKDNKIDRVYQKQKLSISEIESNITSQNKKIRTEIAQNPHTPHSLLKKLAIHESNLIKQNEAIISGISILIEEAELPINNDLLVLYKILQNSQCTLGIKETIFINVTKSQTPSFSRLALFLSDYAENSVLAENSNSISWLERYAIAQNPKTPKYTLKQLAQDGNRIVRATAKESLQKLNNLITPNR